jgi:hypothetical protein
MNSNMETFVPLTFQRRGVQRLACTDAPTHDTTFLVGLARAFFWQSLLNSGAYKSGSEIAKAEVLHHSVVNELLRLTLLAPDIIEMLMAGTQPRALNLCWFQRHPLPVLWNEQREIINSFNRHCHGYETHRQNHWQSGHVSNPGASRWCADGDVHSVDVGQAWCPAGGDHTNRLTP